MRTLSEWRAEVRYLKATAQSGDLSDFGGRAQLFVAYCETMLRRALLDGYVNGAYQIERVLDGLERAMVDKSRT